MGILKPTEQKYTYSVFSSKGYKLILSSGMRLSFDCIQLFRQRLSHTIERKSVRDNDDWYYE